MNRGKNIARGELRATSLELSLAQRHLLPQIDFCPAKEAPSTRMSCIAQRYKETLTSSSAGG